MADAPGGPSSETRQRWRIAYARSEPILDLGPSALAALWEEAFGRSGLPVAVSQARTPRPKLTSAAPLPVGMPAEHELLDAILAARVPRSTVRSSLAAVLPAGLSLVDLFDVWTGAPALTAALAAADYRVAISGPPSTLLGDGCASLLAARALPRERAKGEGRVIQYDLRPLILGLEVAGDGLRMRLRHEQERGIGRPDEILLALAEAIGTTVEPGIVVRERLWTTDELPGADQDRGPWLAPALEAG